VDEKLDLGAFFKRLEQDEATVDVGQDKSPASTIDRSTCVSASEVTTPWTGEKRADELAVPDIAPDELVSRIALDVRRLSRLPA